MAAKVCKISKNSLIYGPKDATEPALEHFVKVGELTLEHQLADIGTSAD